MVTAEAAAYKAAELLDEARSWAVPRYLVPNRPEDSARCLRLAAKQVYRPLPVYAARIEELWKRVLELGRQLPNPDTGRRWSALCDQMRNLADELYEVAGDGDDPGDVE